MFKVIIHRKALSEIKAIPNKDKRRLLDAVKAMGSDPFSGDVKPNFAAVKVFARLVEFGLARNLVVHYREVSPSNGLY